MKTKIRLGYWDKSCREKLYYPGDAHAILIAPSGSGKNRDVVIPTLIEFEGSCICIDPKAQNGAVTGHYRQSGLGQRVVELNPFNILPGPLAGLECMGHNPMNVLDPRSDTFATDCDSISDGLVYQEGAADSHWPQSAQQVISGVIMTLAMAAPRNMRNLVAAYEIITGAHFEDFVRQAARSKNFMICGRLGRFAVPRASESKELSSIRSTAITQLNFIGNAAIARSLNPAPGCDLRFASLRERATTVYITLGTRNLSTCSKWFRLVIASAMSDLLREGKPAYRTLAVLDEFAQLGTLKVMSDVMGIGRGHGVSLFPVLQNLTQLSRLYKEDWETFLSNAGAQCFLAPRDATTADYVSKIAGVSERISQSRSVSEQGWGNEATKDHFSINTSYGQTARPLFLPHEVRGLPGDEMLVFGESLSGVIRAGRKPYFKMPECRNKYRPDPEHTQQKSGGTSLLKGA